MMCPSLLAWEPLVLTGPAASADAPERASVVTGARRVFQDLPCPFEESALKAVGCDQLSIVGTILATGSR